MTITAMKTSRREVRKTVKALTKHVKQCKIAKAKPKVKRKAKIVGHAFVLYMFSPWDL